MPIASRAAVRMASHTNSFFHRIEMSTPQGEGGIHLEVGGMKIGAAAASAPWWGEEIAAAGSAYFQLRAQDIGGWQRRVVTRFNHFALSISRRRR